MQTKPPLSGDNGREEKAVVELGHGAASVSRSVGLTISLLPKEGEVLGEARGMGRGRLPGWQHPQPGVPGRAVLQA